MNRKGFMSPILLVVIFMVAGGLIYFSQSRNNQTNVNYQSDMRSVTPSASSQSSVVSCQEGEWITCKFNKYPLEFQYPTEFTLEQNLDGEVNVIGLFKGDLKVMTIRPEQNGFGIGNPEIESSSLPILLEGKRVFLNGKEISKTKLYNKSEKTTHYITIIQYPDQRDYSIMVPSFFDDNSENKGLSETYDKVISTFRFTE